MKTIIIKSIRLTNFKGVRSLEVNFDDKLTSIYGANGTGKTTIFDAIIWLLFGKDSQDRKVFNIKTLDETGNPIPKLPHEVSAVLSVNGEEIVLCRRFNEQWVKHRGSAVEEFEGHKEERFYNDVPLNVSEWKQKIDTICPEQTFKSITNPHYFTSQKPEVQRAALFRMAGDVSDSEIAAGNEQFEKLLLDMSGKTMTEYKREIANHKRRIKNEMEGIPQRIDERQRTMPQAENWDALEKELAEKNEVLRSIENSLEDKAKAYTKASDDRLNISRQISSMKQSRLLRENEIRMDVEKEFLQSQKEQSQLKSNLMVTEDSIASLEKKKKAYEDQVVILRKKRETLLAEWQTINAKTLSFNEDEFICPTCKRRFELDEIEHRQQELTENFNQQKAKELGENNAKGVENNKRIEEALAAIAEVDTKIAESKKEVEKIKSSALFNKTLSAPDVTPFFEKDMQLKEIDEKIASFEKVLAEPLQIPDNTELKTEKYKVENEIFALKQRLAQKSALQEGEKRIAELNTQLRNLNEELAHYEGVEFNLAAFSKARITAIEGKINNLFTIVRFKMFDTLINGDEVETCQATVGGVPYGDGLNNAMAINAGLDIINAICRFEGITAPIVIDNAESINKLLPTAAQVIRLVVTEDSQLRIS